MHLSPRSRSLALPPPYINSSFPALLLFIPVPLVSFSFIIPLSDSLCFSSLSYSSTAPLHFSRLSFIVHLLLSFLFAGVRVCSLSFSACPPRPPPFSLFTCNPLPLAGCPSPAVACGVRDTGMHTRAVYACTVAGPIVAHATTSRCPVALSAAPRPRRRRCSRSHGGRC